MSQINTQNLLRLGNTANEPSIATPPIEFNQSAFQGGGVQVGAARQQIGPSSEQAMYGALAEIAGGVKSGISIFSEIAGNEEKAKIEKAKLEYKKIFSGEFVERVTVDGTLVKEYLTPQQKMQEWNAYIKDIQTPFLGNNWKTDLNIDAYNTFGSREAQEKFEAERYERTKIDYFTKNNIKNTQDPAELVAFDQWYSNEFKTSSGNAWFNATAIKNRDLLKNEQTQDALRTLNSSIAKIISIPNESEMQEVINKGPEADAVKQAYPTFFQLADSYDGLTIEQMQYGINDFLTAELVNNQNNPNKDKPYILSALKKSIDEATLELGPKMWQAVGTIRRQERNATAQIGVTTAELTFKADPISEKNRAEYALAIARAIPVLGKPSSENALLFTNTLETIFASLDTPGLLPTGENYVDWNQKSAREKVDIVIEEITSIYSAPGNEAIASNLANSLSIPVGDLNLWLKSTGRGALYNSKPVQQDHQDQIKTAVQGADTNITAISSLINPADIIKRTNLGIEALGRPFNLKTEDLRRIYITKAEDGTEDITTDFEKSFNAWAKEKGKTFTGSELNQIKEITRIAIKLEQAAIGRLQEKAVREYSTDGLSIDLTNYETSNGNFSHQAKPDAREVDGRISTAVLIGKAFNEKTKKEYVGFLSSIIEAQTVINSIPSELRQPDGTIDEKRLTPVQKNALDVLKTFEKIQSENPEFYTRAVLQIEDIRDINQRALVVLPELLSITKDGKPISAEDIQKRAKELSTKFIQKTINGELKPFNGTMDSSLSNPYNNDGTLTDNAIMHLLQVELTTERLLNGTPEDRKNFGTITKDLFNAVGTQADLGKKLADPSQTMQVLTMVLMGKELARYKDTPGGELAGTNFNLQHLFILASASERTDIPGLIEYFNDPTVREQSSMLYGLPLMIAERIALGSAGNNQFTVEMGGENQQFPIREFIIRDNRGRSIANSLFQLNPEQQTLEQKALANGQPIPAISFEDRINPYNPQWSPTYFAGQLMAAGVIEEGISTEVLAGIIKKNLLEGVIQEDKTPEEIIRLGAQVLYNQNQNIPNSVYYGAELFLSPRTGIENPVWQPGKAESLAANFFHFVAGTLDVSTYPYRGIGQSNYGIAGLTAANGTLIESANNQVSPWYSVRGNSPSTSSSPDLYNVFINSVRRSPFTQKDTEGRPVKPGSTFIPNTKKDGTKEDGIPYQIGSALLDTNFNQALLFTSIQHWPIYRNSEFGKSFNPMRQQINTSPEYINTSPEYITGTESIQLTLNEIEQQRKINPNQPIFMDYAFKRLQENYVKTCTKYGIKPENRTDLLDLSSDRNAAGYSTLQQSVNFTAINEMIPTYSWSNRGFTGLPYISITDDVLLTSIKLQNDRNKRNEAKLKGQVK